MQRLPNVAIQKADSPDLRTNTHAYYRVTSGQTPTRNIIGAEKMVN